MAIDQRLPFDTEPAAERPLEDQAARIAAVNPLVNVVLEASAGTGKTRVLVDRYVNLLRAGVQPLNILAITFTRKAAAEMRERIIATLRAEASRSDAAAARWRDLRDRLGEIAISTIDAFCLSLLREFPLEADLDPGFDVADETAAPRLIEESLDTAMRISRSRVRDDEDVALLFAQLGERRLRVALAALLDRRHVASQALDRVLSSGPRDLTIAEACRRGVDRLAGALTGIPGGLDGFLGSGPAGHPAFDQLARDIRALVEAASPGAAPYPPPALRGLLNRLDDYFFTSNHAPRQRAPVRFRAHHPSKELARNHWRLVNGAAAAIDDAARALRRDLNVVLSRAVRRVFAIALSEYRATLSRHGVLDFAELLGRASALLGNMEEFARSRFLLESRYQHVLVDEFQDTSRAQWELVVLLVRAWGEGLGPADTGIPPSIFVVGDRKQSIYGFRDADVSLLDEAAAIIAALRPDDRPVRTITHSFRSAPGILAFVNDVFAEVGKAPERSDAFRYDERDRFPVDEADIAPAQDGVLGVITADSESAAAAATAAEIGRILSEVPVRDRTTGTRRPALPGDIAILFRARETHRPFELALDARRIPSYVYKGLGFFDTDEVKDIVALIRYLADPAADIRAAAFLRSRFVRLSDVALRMLAPGLARALRDPDLPPGFAGLSDEDREVLAYTRAAVSRWLRAADTVPPAELIDEILAETAYAFEWRGPRLAQARENVKKLRGLVRRIQNRGYLTLERLSSHLDTLSLGDESNAVVDAVNAVSLMTVHAAKGLEFPVVFLVGLERGAGGIADPVRVSVYGDPEEAVSVGDFYTEYDEDAASRDAEETKRLLYVAMTRARDRLYLSVEHSRGRVTPRPASLASVLPDSVVRTMEQAATAGAADAVEWRASSGRAHVLRVCLPPAETLGEPVAGMGGVAGAKQEPDLAAEDDFAVIADVSSPRYAVTALPGPAGPKALEAEPGGTSPALTGRLVHRLFQFPPAEGLSAGERRAHVGRLLRDEERIEAGDAPTIADEALGLYERVRAQADVRAILDGAACLFEVPFSVAASAVPGAVERIAGGGAGTLLRGVIDCVARVAPGSVLVLDFKTGAPRPGDAAQLAVYVEAARHLFPGDRVEGRLVYASHVGEG